MSITHEFFAAQTSDRPPMTKFFLFATTREAGTELELAAYEIVVQSCGRQLVVVCRVLAYCARGSAGRQDGVVAISFKIERQSAARRWDFIVIFCNFCAEHYITLLWRSCFRPQCGGILVAFMAVARIILTTILMNSGSEISHGNEH